MQEAAGSSRFWIWIYAGVGLVMTIAVCVFTWVSIQSREQNTTGTASGPVQHQTKVIPTERYQMLARFDPPPYPGKSPAMEPYSAHDYAAAAAGLRAVTGTEARFYRGVSLLLSGSAAEGKTELRAVIAAGASPYLEQAHFYLAKGLLAGAEISDARIQLNEVIALHGDFEKQAKALLASIG